MDIDHDGGLLFNSVPCYLGVESAGVLDRHCLQTAQVSYTGRNVGAAERLDVMA